MHKISSKFLYFLVATGGLLFGYDTGVISGAIHFVDLSLGVAENTLFEGFVVASVLIGAAVGSFGANKLANIIGRKLSLLISSLLFCAGAIASGLASTAAILIIARIILGLSVGVAATLVPMYLSELAPTSRRGSIAFLNQFAIVVGILLSYIINYMFVAYLSSDWNVSTGWRIALAAAVIPAVILLAASFILPESPRFLVRRGDEDAARELLEKIRPISAVDEELREIKSGLREKSTHLSDAFNKFSRPAIVTVLALAILQQFMGCNTVIYYAPKILDSFGFDLYSQRLATVGIGVFNLVATIIAIFLVDKVSRRHLFIVGGCLMALSIGMLGFIDLFGLQHHLDPSRSVVAQVFVALAILIYIVAFGVTWGGAMWVVLGELLPVEIRAVGVSIAGIVNWAATFIICLIFPAVLGVFNTSTFAVYFAVAAICFGGAVFVKFAVVETKDKTADEVEDEIARRASKRHPAK